MAPGIEEPGAGEPFVASHRIGSESSLSLPQPPTSQLATYGRLSAVLLGQAVLLLTGANAIRSE